MNTPIRIQNRYPKQQGTALIVALIALVAMISAGFALFRSVDTVNLAANNYQFVRTAQQGVDSALNESLLAYMQAHPNAGLRVMDRNWNNPGVNYYAIQQPENGDGIPNVIATLSAPAWSTTGPVATGWPGEQIDSTSQQLRRYVIERMCNSGGIATANNCRLYQFEYNRNGEQVNSGGTAAGSVENLPFIRITVRVDGPKNSVAYAQMFVKAE
jgi:type IV pilus assembly protein PilX